MPKTHITVAFEIPTTSLSRVQDVLAPILRAVEEHRGKDFMTTIRGPIPDDDTKAKTNGNEHSEDREERTADGRLERRAAAGADDAGADDDGGDKPKRGRGRPRKSDGNAEASGSASRKRSGDEDAERAEGAEHDEPKRAREGSDKGTSESRSGSRGASGGRDDQRGNREAPRVKDDGDDWGDDSGDTDDFAEPSEEELEEAAAKSSKAWPDSLTPPDEEIDKPYITKLLGDHYNATGGKDRTLTFDLMDEVTETRKLGEVDEKDYVRLAKALLKDIARYKYGVKKAK